MNDYARELFEDVRIGERVQVTYGNRNMLLEATGVIVKWTENLLTLKNPEAKIPVDDLRSIVKKNLESKPAASEFQRQMAVIQPAKPYVFTFNDSRIKLLWSEIKAACNKNLRNVINSVFDKIQAAIKGKSLKDKYPEAKRQMLNAWSQCDTTDDYRYFYLVLGIIAIVAEDFGHALEPLVRAQEYSLAAYAAARAGRTDYQEIFYLCALLSEKEDTTIDQYVLATCINRRDIEPLLYLLDAHQDDNDSAFCELIASCAAEAYKAAGFHGVNITPLDSAVEVAKKLFNGFPDRWKTNSEIVMCWKEYEGYTYPVPKLPVDTVYTDKIRSFSFSANKGYIGPNSKYSFHVSQIPDDCDEGTLLRRLLAKGQFTGLEVSFFLSKDNWGNDAATDIMLTKDGLSDAKERLSVKPNAIRYGTIKNYFEDRHQGYIAEAGYVDRSFLLSSIVDPYLRAFCLSSNSPKNQFVSFTVSHASNGKEIAKDIVWEEPKPSGWEQYNVSERDLTVWKEYLQKREIDPVQGVEEEGDIAFPDFKYVQLPLGNPNTNPKELPPLTWPKNRTSVRTLDANASVPSLHQVLETVAANPPHPVPETVTAPQPTSAKDLADRGRLERSKGHLDEAEKLLKQALAAGVPADSVIGDLINIYLQQPEKLQEGISLLEQHVGEMQPNKVLNLKIQVYDKLKDPGKLVTLYEDAYQQADTISKKSHFLYRLIDAYISLKKYDLALEACRRWESLYQQNRFGPSVSKLKNSESFVERKKAICFYYSNKEEEARRIAVDLIRANPSDETANAILNRTLTENDPLIDTADDSTTYDLDYWGDEDEFGATSSAITGFVKAKIKASDIGSILKGSLKDGKYSGDIKKARDDVKRLAGSEKIELRGGNTAKTRSERLFAACKIIEDVELRGGEQWPRGTEERLAGRAMALWGDSMVSQSLQLDTPRMAYLFAISMLPETKKGAEQHWANAYNRYLKSYFLGREKLGSYIEAQNSTSNQDGPNTDILIQELPKALFAEFFVGILNLLNALAKQERLKDKLIGDLYNRNPDLRNEICQHMRTLLGTGALQESFNLSDFEEAMDRACAIHQKYLVSIGTKLQSIVDIFMETEIAYETLEQLNTANWAHHLTYTDTTRLEEIYGLLHRSQDYFVTTDFENRAECLRTVLSGVSNLQHAIQVEPTDLSYEIFSPVLGKIIGRLIGQQDRLYREFQPLLSWGERPVVSHTREGTILVQLLVKNEVNHQAADSLKIVGNDLGEAVNWLKESPVISSLRGDESQEFILNVGITDTALKDGSFPLKLRYSYKFNSEPLKVIQIEREEIRTVILPSDKPIEYPNPYKGYIGNPMTNEKMFYGRGGMIRQLIELVYSSETDQMNPGHAIAIYGQTRCGKSSIFYHLKTKLQEEYSDRILVWDMGNIGSLSREANADVYLSKFLSRMLARGKISLRKSPRIKERIEDAQLKCPDGEILRHPEYAESLFDLYMMELNDILAEEDYIIVLLIDEFSELYGNIKEGKTPSDFMKFWKGLLESYRLFTFVIGQDNMKEFMDNFQNEFACMELTEISYLEETPAKQLIREPLEAACGRVVFDGAAVDALYQQTAGSAFLTMILCSCLVDYLNDRQPRMVTKGIIDDFLNNWLFKKTETYLKASYFEPQMRERGHSEFTEAYEGILQAVAVNSQTNGWASMEAICRDTKAAVEACGNAETEFLVKRLVDRHILIRENNQYRILVGLLEKWLINTRGGN